jgi:DNA-binding FadR family transcriptional regulator
LVSNIQDAIIEAIRPHGDKPVNVLQIGPVLVEEQGYSQEAVLTALYTLQDRKLIEIMPGNRVRLCDTTPL